MDLIKIPTKRIFLFEKSNILKLKTPKIKSNKKKRK